MRYYDDEGAMHEERVKTALDTYSGFYEEPYETVVHGIPQLVAPEVTVAQLRILEDTTNDLQRPAITNEEGKIMAENDITAAEATKAMDVLVAQERELRYERGFGAMEALDLGIAAARLESEFDEAYTVTITREEDEAIVFQWLGEGKDARNLVFAAGKRAAALASGHASPWAQLEAIASGKALEEVWARVPEVCPSCGAFPIRVGDEWVATIAVSGLHDGLDHEVIVRALEQVLEKTVPRFAVAVA